jgi:hypothetical protein
LDFQIFNQDSSFMHYGFYEIKRQSHFLALPFQFALELLFWQFKRSRYPVGSHNGVRLASLMEEKSDAGIRDRREFPQAARFRQLTCLVQARLRGIGSFARDLYPPERS